MSRLSNHHFLEAPLSLEPCLFYFIALYRPGTIRLGSYISNHHEGRALFGLWECLRAFQVEDATGRALVKIPDTGGLMVSPMKGTLSSAASIRTEWNDMAQGTLSPGSREVSELRARYSALLPDWLDHHEVHFVEGLIRPNQRVIVQGSCTTSLDPPRHHAASGPYRAASGPYRAAPELKAIVSRERKRLFVSTRMVDFLLDCRVFSAPVAQRGGTTHPRRT